MGIDWKIVLAAVIAGVIVTIGAPYLMEAINKMKDGASNG